MSFITEHITYYYKVMPFGPKKTRATYQRLMKKIFKDEMGKSVEVYVNDILVKSLSTEVHIKVLAKAFDIFKKIPNKSELDQVHLCGGGMKIFGFHDLQVRH